MNKDIKYAWDYHEATKHSEISLMTQRRYLDFDNRPIPFKIYTTNFPAYPAVAYAQGIGASGSTFFDDAVTEFFSPHADKKSTMIVVGIG